MKKILIGLSFALFGLQSCDVLDVDPQSFYSENVAYASIENVDFYVKDLYQAFHEYSDIEKPVDVYDDGFSDLLKYSWAAIAPGNQVNKFFYYRQGINADRDFRTKWNQAYWHIRELNEFLVDMHNGLASGLDQNKLAIRVAEVRAIRAFVYQELVKRYGGIVLRISEEKVDDHTDRSKARSSEAECWDFIINELDKAAALLEKMVTRFPSKQAPLFSLLDIYSRQEKYNDVISTLNRLEKRLGKNEQLSMEKFRIYLQMKDDKKVFQEIESLVQEYPMDMRYQVILGDVYLQNGKKQEAYDAYQKVLAVEPDNPMALFSMASYYEQTGQKELYQQQLDTLLLNKKVTSDTKISVMRQVIAENEQSSAKDSTQVIALFDRMMKQDMDDPQIPMLYSQYLLSKNMEQEAVPVLEQVVDLDPTNKAARLMLVSAAVKKEDYKQIIKVCEPGIEATPDALELYYYLAIAYHQAEQGDSVLSVCNRALEHITPDTRKEVISDFYSIMGDIYHTKKQMTEAYAAYDSALVYNPSNIGALNNYAYYLSVERRDLDKAEEMSYKTVKAEPNNSTYLDTYAWILFEKGNYAEARIYIDNAMKNDGEKSDVIVEHCGDIYFMTGDVEGALKYWKKALEMGSESKTLKQKIEKKQYIAE